MAIEAPSPAQPRQAQDKIRLIFRKDGSLRWLSHHDLLRTFERMLRRAELPVHHSGGFHPHARLVFALSLPLGVVGLAEVLDIEMSEYLDLATIQDRIQAQCPPGLHILGVRRVPLRSGLRVLGLCYGLTVPLEHTAALATRIEAIRQADEWLIERTRPPRRTLDIRPYVREMRLDATTGRLEVDLHLTQAGTARPDEVLALLNLSDLVEAGVVVERVRLDLDETTRETDSPAPLQPEDPPPSDLAESKE
jgi:radical SAM-linked protein